MSTGEPEKIKSIEVPNIKIEVPEIPMQVTLKEALEILKERAFQLPDSAIFNLVDKISEYIYPSDPEH